MTSTLKDIKAQMQTLDSWMQRLITLLEDISEWAWHNGTIKEVFQHLFRATNITSLLSLLVLLLGTLQPY